MKRLQFTCTLLTDVVLSSNAATEGFHKSLGYIPGAKFLGIVAGKVYDMKASKQTLDLFHNGCVRFGDAHPMGEDQSVSFKVPASWHYPKGDRLEQSIYLHHNLTSAIKEDLIGRGIQLKQARSDYFTDKGDLIEVEQNFSIKSAYDQDKYRAENAQMYGYFALKKGSQWRFYVDMDDEQYEEVVCQSLIGKQRIGRSSSAEYGLVEIIKNEDLLITNKQVDSGEIYLYALSNLCFYDDLGRNTLQPDPEIHLLLPLGSRIIWEKSQIRCRRYLTWNKNRGNRDSDRMIIEEGSVIAIQLSQSINTKIFERGIGAHRSEGFGNIIINPEFLLSQAETLDLPLLKKPPLMQAKPYFPVEKGVSDDFLLDYLEERLAATKAEIIIDQKVNHFILAFKEKFDGVTSSQWGQIRNVAKNVHKPEFLREIVFNKDIGFCYSGQSEVKWRENGRRKILEEYLFDTSGLSGDSILDLAMKLSTEMAKTAKNKVSL